MIFYKYKRAVHFLFALKHLLNAIFDKNIQLVVITSLTMIILLALFLKKKHQILHYSRICLLLEISIYDQPFAPIIAVSLNYKVTQQWIILILYSVRIATIYCYTFKIIEWVFYGVQFVGFMLCIYKQSQKKTHQKEDKLNEKTLYHNMNSQVDSSEMFDILNYMPFGICLLDANQNVITANRKLRKYVSIVQEQCLQQQLFLMIQKAFLQMNQQNLNRKHNRQKSWFNSEDGSEFQIKRLTSFSQMRNRAATQQRQFSNISDIGQILSLYSQKNVQESTNLDSLKFKDIQDGKTYQIKIFEISQGTMIILENITTKQNQLDVEERYRFQSMLINSFSHELRTPLNCSLQLLQILQSQLKQELNNQYLKPAIISNKKLLHQINDILDFANFESQKFKLRPSQFKLSSIVNVIKDYYQAECDQKHINLIFQICQDTCISNDYERIMQILVNLMNNSVKYTKSHNEIHFIINRVGCIYQFEIFDTGCGISVEKLYLINKILRNSEIDFMKRGDEDYLQYVGLGLKVSSQIAKQLCQQGGLNITSNIGQFTKARFQVKDLKLYDSMSIPTDECIQQPYINKIKQQGLTEILICDDIPFNHMALKTVLKFYNIHCDSAYDGQMAIDMVMQKSIQGQCYKKCQVSMDIKQQKKLIVFLIKKNQLHQQLCVVLMIVKTTLIMHTNLE